MASAPEVQTVEGLVALPLGRINSSWIENVRPEAETNPSDGFVESTGAFQLQPIVVSDQAPGDKFGLVAGWMRLAAAKARGAETILARVTQITKKEAYVLNIVENVDRSDVNPVSVAKRLEMLHSKKLPIKALAERCGQHYLWAYKRVRAVRQIPESLLAKLEWAGIGFDLLQEISELPDAQLEELEASIGAIIVERAAGEDGGQAADPKAQVAEAAKRTTQRVREESAPPAVKARAVKDVQERLQDMTERKSSLDDFGKGQLNMLEWFLFQDPETQALGKAVEKQKGEDAKKRGRLTDLKKESAALKEAAQAAVATAKEKHAEAVAESKAALEAARGELEKAALAHKDAIKADKENSTAATKKKVTATKQTLAGAKRATATAEAQVERVKVKATKAVESAKAKFEARMAGLRAESEALRGGASLANAKAAGAKAVKEAKAA